MKKAIFIVLMPLFLMAQHIKKQNGIAILGGYGSGLVGGLEYSRQFTDKIGLIVNVSYNHELELEVKNSNIPLKASGFLEKIGINYAVVNGKWVIAPAIILGAGQYQFEDIKLENGVGIILKQPNENVFGIGGQIDLEHYIAKNISFIIRGEYINYFSSEIIKSNLIGSLGLKFTLGQMGLSGFKKMKKPRQNNNNNKEQTEPSNTDNNEKPTLEF